MNKPDSKTCIVCSKRAPESDEKVDEALVAKVASHKRQTDVKAQAVQGLSNDIESFLATLRQNQGA